MSKGKMTMEGLAHRLIACKHFRWIDGMSGFAPTEQGGSKLFRVDEFYRHTEGHYPNLHDPATLGCLLYLVQDIWGIGVFLFPDGGWYVRGARLLEDRSTINLGICEQSYEAALVAALEAANHYPTLLDF